MKEINIKKTPSDDKGVNASFEIKVSFTQNATWQGDIHWIEKKQKQNFRSALEMVKLMDEAIFEDAGEEKKVCW